MRSDSGNPQNIEGSTALLSIMEIHDQRSRSKGRIPVIWNYLRKKDPPWIWALSSHGLRSWTEWNRESELSLSLRLVLHTECRPSVSSCFTSLSPCLHSHNGQHFQALDRNKFFSEADFVATLSQQQDQWPVQSWTDLGIFNSCFFHSADRKKKLLVLVSHSALV